MSKIRIVAKEFNPKPFVVPPPPVPEDILRMDREFKEITSPS